MLFGIRNVFVFAITLSIQFTVFLLVHSEAA